MIIRRLLIIPSLLILSSGIGCAGSSKYEMTGSGKAPDADGRISVEKVEGGNSMVTLDLEHLAPPQRMENQATTYVVWFQKPGQPPSLVGHLSYDPGNRTGTMRATTTDRQFNVVVTAEPTEVVSTPSNIIVFQKQVETP
jgi:hypothetical protein